MYGAKVHRRQFWFRFVVVYGTSHSQTSLTFNFFLLKNVFWLLSLSFPCLFLQIFWYHCYLVILYPKAHWVVPLSWLWVCILLFFCQLAFRHFLSSIAVQVFFSIYVYYSRPWVFGLISLLARVVFINLQPEQTLLWMVELMYNWLSLFLSRSHYCWRCH